MVKGTGQREEMTTIRSVIATSAETASVGIGKLPYPRALHHQEIKIIVPVSFLIAVIQYSNKKRLSGEFILAHDSRPQSITAGRRRQEPGHNDWFVDVQSHKVGLRWMLGKEVSSLIFQKVYQRDYPSFLEMNECDPGSHGDIKHLHP